MEEVITFPSGYASQQGWTDKYKKINGLTLYSDRILIEKDSPLISLFLAEVILDKNTQVNPKYEAKIKTQLKELAEGYLANTGVQPQNLDTLKGLNPNLSARPHQLSGVESILRLRKGWLGDDLGAGKTLMSLASAIEGNQLPCVCVVKPTTAGTWKKEQEKFFPEYSSVILQGETPYEVEPHDFYIIGYSVMQYWVDYLNDLRCKAFVFDEAHKLSDFRTFQSKAAAQLTKDLEPENIVLLITTTPLKKGPFQMWHHLNILSLVKEFGGNYNKFGDIFCDRQKKYGRWDMSGSTNLDHLHDLLVSTYMVRRLKSSYLPKEISELCGVEKNLYECNLTEKEFKKYSKLQQESDEEILSVLEESLEVDRNLVPDGKIEEVKRKLLGRKKFLLALGDGKIRIKPKKEDQEKKEQEKSQENHARFTRTHMMGSYLSSIKLSRVLDFIENFNEEQPDEKIIVFARSRDMQRALAGVELDEREVREFPFPKKEIKRAAKLAKEMNTKTIFAVADQGLEEISEAIESFQTDPKVRMIVVSMGNVESHTLTAGWYILWADLPYSRSDEAQGEGRAAGRVNDPHGAFSWKLVMNGPNGEPTVDHNFLNNIQNSKEVTDAVLDGNMLK